MKNIIRLLFLVLLLKVTLLATPARQAASLANDAYLPPHEFLHKYESTDYSLTWKKNLSIDFYIFTQKRQLFVVFEGTNNIESFQTDLDVNEVSFFDNKESRVHNGYYKEAMLAYANLYPFLNRDKQIIVTGHSLGGAVAHLLAAILYKKGYDVQLYTFGSPPVGNENFARMIDSLPHERYTHVFDLVPLLKKENLVRMKEALTYVNSELPENETFVDFVNTMDSFSYEYVHQGNHHYIYNLGSLSKEEDESSWYIQMLIRAQLYHSSKNYLEGLQ